MQSPTKPDCWTVTPARPLLTSVEPSTSSNVTYLPQPWSRMSYATNRDHFDGFWHHQQQDQEWAELVGQDLVFTDTINMGHGSTRLSSPMPISTDDGEPPDRFSRSRHDSLPENTTMVQQVSFLGTNYDSIERHESGIFDFHDAHLGTRSCCTYDQKDGQGHDSTLFLSSPSSLITDSESLFSSSPGIATPQSSASWLSRSHETYSYTMADEYMHEESLPIAPTLLSQPFPDTCLPSGHQSSSVSDSDGKTTMCKVEASCESAPRAASVMMKTKFRQRRSRHCNSSARKLKFENASDDETAADASGKPSDRRDDNLASTSDKAGKNCCQFEKSPGQICNQSFSRQEHLTRHFQSHNKAVLKLPQDFPHITVYQCPACWHLAGKIFRSIRRDNFNDHLGKHPRAWVLQQNPVLRKNLDPKSEKNFKAEPASPALMEKLVLTHGVLLQGGGGITNTGTNNGTKQQQKLGSQDGQSPENLDSPARIFAALLYRLMYRELPGVDRALYDFPSFKHLVIGPCRRRSGQSVVPR